MGGNDDPGLQRKNEHLFCYYRKKIRVRTSARTYQVLPLSCVSFASRHCPLAWLQCGIELPLFPSICETHLRVRRVKAASSCSDPEPPPSAPAAATRDVPVCPIHGQQQRGRPLCLIVAVPSPPPPHLCAWGVCSRTPGAGAGDAWE